MKSKIIILILFSVTLLQSLIAQDDKTVTLTVSGSGKTQQEALTSALRNAIEQAFGTFISSNTQILNDNLIKGEIISVSSGNIQEYKENKYPHYKYSAGKKVYPMIVTLENWLLFGDELLTRLERFVSKRMIEKNLPMEWLSEMPYSVCSIDEFENIIQISEKVGLEKIMRGKLFDGENKKWNFDSFLLNNFPEEYKNCSFIFSDEFKTILPERAYE